jgi:glycosyltransferase involved in cell wall biosynthesis
MIDAMVPERSAGTRNVPISVIIPSYGRAALLRETVQSVLAAEERPAEMVIIDQSPEPDRWLLQLAPQDCEIRYVLSTEVGASLARNRGARLARFPILAFIDDDVRVRPDWVRACLDSARAAGPRTVLTGRVLPGESGAPDGFVPSTIDSEEPVIVSRPDRRGCAVHEQHDAPPHYGR